MNEQEVRILKTASCPSLSGRSTLTYHIGCKDDGSIHLRLSENTGAGMFSKDWIPFARLDMLLGSGEKQFTAGLMRSLFKGKSVNSAGFTLAVLLAEGLLKICGERHGNYVRTDSTRFREGIQALVESSSGKQPSKNDKVKKASTKKPD